MIQWKKAAIQNIVCGKVLQLKEKTLKLLLSAKTWENQSHKQQKPMPEPVPVKVSATRVTPQNEKAKTLKELQMAYYMEATENQKAQKECFQKLSTLADVLTLKFS
ncbi:uncharacterized protein LOC128216977 [Mya arenaria]|uniref:uncharacterized protein LOC128216977 n=1 Tax=Mya arenaria TaxID=6604 RepID=UPI0022E45BB5|nr:uncharacterized protein LOC128216977 [Mya arenaria]